MSDFQNGQNLDGEHLKAARKRYTRQAAAWTRQQAGRLGVTESEIIAAIRRTWLPSDIEALPASQASYLNRSPIIAALAASQVKNIVRDSCHRERRRNRQVAGDLKRAKAA